MLQNFKTWFLLISYLMKIESLTITSIIGPYSSTLASLTSIKLFVKCRYFQRNKIIKEKQKIYWNMIFSTWNLQMELIVEQTCVEVAFVLWYMKLGVDWVEVHEFHFKSSKIFKICKLCITITYIICMLNLNHIHLPINYATYQCTLIMAK